jgi:hypothetical protein
LQYFQLCLSFFIQRSLGLKQFIKAGNFREF